MCAERLKIKKLSSANWTEPDPTSGLFAQYDRATLEPSRLTGDDWAERILAVELDGGVPNEVQDLWAVGRSVLLYGWFSYPLYTVGDEQMHRVADSAVHHRYLELGGPLSANAAVPSFYRRLKWLFAAEQIPAEREQQWTAVRELRNAGSHSEMQSLRMPLDALTSLKILAQLINGLWDHEYLR